MKDKTLHLVGNAHIDPVWLWQWQEGFHEVLSTFRSALDRIGEDPDFVFTASSAAFYEWVEQANPAMFAEIRQRVAEGRWQLAGGWWIEPDCNIPAGESFVRQGLYGQRYFRAKFGKIARVGYNPDSFGHNAMLPQILQKCGLQAYVFLRPSAHEKPLPGDLFWWEASDGSRVLALRIPYEYCSWPADIERHVRRVAATLKPPFAETLCFYGVGNHGGGPTRANLACLHRLESDPGIPHLVFDGLDALAAWAAAGSGNGEERSGLAAGEATHPGPEALPVPVVRGDLQHHASGCYAAHAGVKRWNRQAENALLAAEKWAAIAAWTTGQPYPGADLARAWKSVLFNQFHDIMAGTSIEPAYEDARNGYGEAFAIAGRALNLALQSIGWQVQSPPQEGVRPLLVFNPHAWPARLPVACEFGRLDPGDRLLDDEGVPVPMQALPSAAAARGRSRLCFVADLPPLGYRAYRVVPAAGESAAAGDARPAAAAQPPVPGADAGPAPGEAGLEAGATSLESGRFRLEINPATGCIQDLYDKAYGTAVFQGEAARPVVVADDSDTWSHNVYRYDRVVGEFKPAAIRLVEQGGVRATLRVESAWGRSQLVQEFTLYRDLHRVDVAVTLDWHEEHQLLKLRFPANIAFQHVTYEIPYGHTERFANGDEDPGQGWVDVSGESRQTGARYGVSILNDGKYSFDVNLRDIGLTVVRSPIYAHHIPYAPEPDRAYTYMDQGVQRFHYTILPHAGSWEEAGTVAATAELNQPGLVLPATFHPEGTLPPCASYLSVDAANVIVSVVKQAEDESHDIVLRAYETAGAATHARICLPHWRRVVAADFAPCEIKTFRVPFDHDLPVRETDMLEE